MDLTPTRLPEMDDHFGSPGKRGEGRYQWDSSEDTLAFTASAARCVNGTVTLRPVHSDPHSVNTMRIGTNMRKPTAVFVRKCKRLDTGSVNRSSRTLKFVRVADCNSTANTMTNDKRADSIKAPSTRYRSASPVCGTVVKCRNSTRISDIMTPAKRLKTAQPDQPAVDLLEQMDDYDIDQILVVQEDKLVGMVARERLIRFLKARAVLKA